MIFDLTDQFRTELRKLPQELPLPPASAARTPPNLRLYATYSEDINQLLGKIRGVLSESRERYFSNAAFSFEAFSDRQRTELNESVKGNLQSVLAQINELNEGLGKGSWFRRKTEEEHMKAVVRCLYQLFKDTERLYLEFQEFSLTRSSKLHASLAVDREKQKARFGVPAARSSRNQLHNEELEFEATKLLMQKQSRQRQIEDTRGQMEKIYQMMKGMSNVVLEQELKTEGLMSIGETGLFHIERGNKNLVEANMLANATGKWWSLLFLSMAVSLLLVDFLNS